MYISAACGTNLTRLVAFGEDSLNQFATAPITIMNFIPESPQDWCGAENNPGCVSIDITQWIGIPNVQIIFESYNGFGNNIFVDNVMIEGTLNSIETEKVSPEKLSVYPNPTESSFTIKLNDMEGMVNIRLLDISGQILYSDEINCSGNYTSKQYTFNELKKGIYLIQAINRSEVLSQKIIIK